MRKIPKLRPQKAQFCHEKVSGRLDLSSVLLELGKRGAGDPQLPRLAEGGLRRRTIKEGKKIKNQKDKRMKLNYSKAYLRDHELFSLPWQVLQLMVEGGAVLQGQMLKEGLAEECAVGQQVECGRRWDASCLLFFFFSIFWDRKRHEVEEDDRFRWDVVVVMVSFEKD